MVKVNCLSEVDGRDEQFRRIGELKQAFLEKGLPVLSIDTKKKETIGNFHRNGSCYAKQPRKVGDHDFKSHILRNGHLGRTLSTLLLKMEPHRISQVSRAWDGVVFENIHIVKARAEQTKTKTGLEVKVWTNNKEYQTKRTVEENSKANLSDFMRFAEANPNWAYLIRT